MEQEAVVMHQLVLGLYCEQFANPHTQYLNDLRLIMKCGCSLEQAIREHFKKVTGSRNGDISEGNDEVEDRIYVINIEAKGIAK